MPRGILRTHLRFGLMSIEVLFYRICVDGCDCTASGTQSPASTMPVRPRFSVSQDDKVVKIAVNVPYVRVGNAEINVEGRNVSFWCKPFLLRLTLPHEVLDAKGAGAVYDPNIVR